MSPEPADSIQRFPEGPPLEEERWCSYRELLALVHHATAMNLNRQLPANLVRRLDPKGINTFSFVMLHGHIDQEPVPEGREHVRAYAFIKLRGKGNPHELHLDIPYPMWKRWRTKMPYSSMATNSPWQFR